MAAVPEGSAVQEGGAEKDQETDSLAPVVGLYEPRVAYLLVSPPVGWATNLLTLNLGGFFGKRPKPPKTKDAAALESTDSADSSIPTEEQKLLDNATLAIYGDRDVFVAAKRYREWASRLESAPGTQFRAHEISTAGHFYIELGTMQKVSDAVRAFARELVAP